MDFTTGGRFEVRITSADVGKRVSVRRLTEAGAPSEKFTDTVGVLTSWDSGVLSITRRSGEIVRIPESVLVAGKVVPGAPARRRGPAARWDELDRVAARAWPAALSARLGDWELRWAGGFTRRANSVLAVGDPGVPLDRALKTVTAWYTQRGGPAYIQVSTGGAGGAQEHLAAELAARGWIREVSALIRTAALSPLADAAADSDEEGARVVLTRAIDGAWLSRYRRFEETAPEVLKVLGGGPSVWFATVPAAEEGAPPAAIGRCVIDGRWAGFTAIEVAPGQRRQGLATAVMAALARKAQEEGASAAYLQVESDNGPAGALYDGMGFTTHHQYHHYRGPEDDAR
ncbi:GNAT family N-acetyltransferase [Streptomyces sp. NPDC051776]|uniref:GNAT family N-acetyltransferase n=1 Tax=Streptomyces sp. NPDC051776 TaxID=3155414 RepID=UPI0034145023